jgi:putative lipoic acid-binding regulatory protein
VSTSEEQQETLVKFPCDFMIKAMGKSTPEFHETVVSIVQQHDESFTKDKIVERDSKKGTFVSVTFYVYVESKPELDAIYQNLTDSEHVLWSM